MVDGRGWGRVARLGPCEGGAGRLVQRRAVDATDDPASPGATPRTTRPGIIIIFEILSGPVRHYFPLIVLLPVLRLTTPLSRRYYLVWAEPPGRTLKAGPYASSSLRTSPFVRPHYTGITLSSDAFTSLDVRSPL